MSKPDLMSIAVTSILERIIALTLMVPKFTIPLRIFSSSLKSSDVSSRASERSSILIFDLRVPVLFLTNDEEKIRSEVTGLKTFWSSVRGKARDLATARLFRDAKTLGITSPKKSRRKVITTTLIMNPRTGSELKSNILELRKAARSTMAILIVLFATRIVLSSFSGLLVRFNNVLDFLSFPDLKFSISSGRREKKATSAADIMADPIKRIMTIKKPITILISGVLKPITDTGNKFDRR